MKGMAQVTRVGFTLESAPESTTLMAPRIKDDAAKRSAGQVTNEIGEGLIRLTSRRSAPDLVETLMAISQRCSSLPDLDTQTADEILGYDNIGTFR